MWPERKRILLVDKHRLFGECLSNAIREIASITIAGALRDAAIMIETHPRFDLILLNLDLPDGDGFRLFPYLDKLADPPPVVVLSGKNLPGEQEQSRRMGAKGYLHEGCETEELIRAIGLVVNHDIEYWPPSRPDRQATSSRALGITPRQIEVLQLVARGYSNRDIGQTLGITEATVKSHLTTLFQILNVRNRNACVFTAREMGLIR